MPQELNPDLHRQQIETYIREYPYYNIFAAALKRVFEHACEISAVEATVQARPKTISSFAEKCVRRFGPKYSDPAHQFTDLCGARIVVQTIEQVLAVKRFIEANFDVLERDDKTSLLGADKFGYRDMHYLVRLNPARCEAIGFTGEECSEIGRRVAEVQVRTLVQHAWADIIHDRVYKAPLKLSAEARRTTSLLAAIMEDGDRAFERLAGELDGMAANYTAYADPDKVENEIAVQELILVNEINPARRAAIALQLARLLAPGGKYSRVVEVVEPVVAGETTVQFELKLELGSALCRRHRAQPHSAEYKLGQKYLEEVIEHCLHEDHSAIRNVRRHASLLARACSRLAWSWEATLPGTEGRALQYYRQAIETEPANPYHLANQLGFEIYCQRTPALIESMRTAIRQAIATCSEHAVAGTELPYALFTAGRLSLLLGDAHVALGWYARGIRHFLDHQSSFVPARAAGLLDDEVAWVQRLHFGAVKPPEEHDWIERLLALARSPSPAAPPAATPLPSPAPDHSILILAGGGGSIPVDLLGILQPMLVTALQYFRGTIISGGIPSGIPGCIGAVAARLQSEGRKQFRLVGYLPSPARTDGYDQLIPAQGEKEFSPGSILQMWEDLRRQGISPGQVTLLGFGGDRLTGVQYQVALALGATVAAVAGSGGASDEILTHPIWSEPPSVWPLPFDAASIQAFVTSHTFAHDPQKLVEMGQAFHENYLTASTGRLEKSLRPWGSLDPDFQKASIEQAGYAVEILRASGFDVERVEGEVTVFQDFTPEEIERMSELEHGRWNVDRLRHGWRPGAARNNDAKIHDNIVAWKDLPEAIREYDRVGVRAFPRILATAKLQVFRPTPKGR